MDPNHSREPMKAKARRIGSALSDRSGPFIDATSEQLKLAMNMNQLGMDSSTGIFYSNGDVDVEVEDFVITKIQKHYDETIVSGSMFDGKSLLLQARGKYGDSICVELFPDQREIHFFLPRPNGKIVVKKIWFNPMVVHDIVVEVPVKFTKPEANHVGYLQ